MENRNTLEIPVIISRFGTIFIDSYNCLYEDKVFLKCIWTGEETKQNTSLFKTAGVRPGELKTVASWKGKCLF